LSIGEEPPHPARASPSATTDSAAIIPAFTTNLYEMWTQTVELDGQI